MIPRVSIAIRAYRRRWLSEAIASVLTQTCTDLELVVYDDAGTLEDVARAAGDSRVRYVPAAYRHGASGRFRAAVSQCRGEFIGLLDDDDYYAPAFVERLLAALTEEPRAGIAFCRTTFDANGRLYSPVDPRPSGVLTDAARGMLAGRWTVSPSHMLIRRTALEQAWDEQPMPDGVSPDIFVNMRVALAGWTHVLVDEPLVVCRWHDTQLSRRSDATDLPIATWRGLRIDEPSLWPLRDRVLAWAYLARGVARLCAANRTAGRDDLRAAASVAPDAWPTARRMLMLAAHGGPAGTALVRLCMAIWPRGGHRTGPARHIGAVRAPQPHAGEL